MAQHLYGPSAELIDGGGTDLHLVDPAATDTITIDCASCVMRDTPTCEGLRRDVPVRSRANRPRSCST